MATARLDRDEVSDGFLPQMCLRCGAAATVEQKKTFSWCPPWVGVLILAGLLPYIIVHIIMTKRMTVQAPLCADHKNHWAWRNWFIWGGFGCCLLLGIASIVVLSSQGNQRGGRNPVAEQLAGMVCFGSAVIGFLWLIAAALIQHWAIRPTEITDYGITLVNVSRDFTDALKEYRGRHSEDNPYRRRPRRWSRDDDDAFREGDGP